MSTSFERARPLYPKLTPNFVFYKHKILGPQIGQTVATSDRSLIDRLSVLKPLILNQSAYFEEPFNDQLQIPHFKRDLFRNNGKFMKEIHLTVINICFSTFITKKLVRNKEINLFLNWYSRAFQNCSLIDR